VGIFSPTRDQPTTNQPNKMNRIEMNAAVNNAVDLNRQVKEWEAAVKANPNGFFEEQMAEELPALREKARLANNAAHEAQDGYEFNTFLDEWMPR